MKELLSLIQKFRDSNTFVAQRSAEFLSNNSTADIIEKYNREQLAEGEDADGNDLGGYGMRRTVERKDAGLQTDFIDLKFSGDFYDSIFAQGELKGSTRVNLKIDSIGDKWEEIKHDERFENALGLTQENADKVGVSLAEHIAKELNKYYGS